MTKTTRAILKTRFENGDVPDSDDFVDLIDSSLNLSDSATQDITSPINVSIANISRLSSNEITATTLNVDFINQNNVPTNPYISAYVSGTAVVQASAAASTDISLDVEWVICSNNLFTTSANTIKYMGEVSALFHFQTFATVLTSAPETLTFDWHIGGVEILPSLVYLETSNEYKSLALQACGQLKPGDESFINISHAQSGAFNLNIRSMTTVVRKV